MPAILGATGVRGNAEAPGVGRAVTAGLVGDRPGSRVARPEVGRAAPLVGVFGAPDVGAAGVGDPIEEPRVAVVLGDGLCVVPGVTVTGVFAGVAAARKDAAEVGAGSRVRVVVGIATVTMPRITASMVRSGVG